jgi:hypothetical protein
MRERKPLAGGRLARLRNAGSQSPMKARSACAKPVRGHGKPGATEHRRQP